MQKVFLNRFWVMTGRWQLMFLERPVGAPRRLERAWMRSVYAPYWRGSGWALTAGPYSLRFGLCRPGMDIDESADDFDWGEFDAGFDEHLQASVFEAGPIDNIDVDIGESIEPEPVTALIDVRSNTLIAVVHEGGEVEYRTQEGHWTVDEPVHHTP
jgi:hypothetical protein